MTIKMNNSITLKDSGLDGESFNYTPYLRGGAVQWDVDLSKLGCGCVTGVYAVKASSYCTNEADITASIPMCKSIDLMQANPYGFHTQLNPCANGTCDAISQCQYDMAHQGVARYGAGAYGAGGSLIDTN